MHPLQTSPKQAFAESSHRFASFLSNPLPCSDTDKIDQSEDAQQSAKAMLLRHSRTLQIEASAFESLKQALNLPSTAVIREQISPLATGDNQPFSVSERLSCKVNRNSKEKNSTCFAPIGSSKERAGLLVLFFRSQDTVIPFDSQTKRDFIFSQPFQPILPSELSVSGEIFYLLHAKELKELCE